MSDMEEPRIRAVLATEDGGMKICYAPGPLLQMFVAEMVQLLRDHNDAPNYVESELISQEDGSRWILLVQRAEGLTPGHKAAMAEQKVKMLQARVDYLEARLASGEPTP